jgi:hypothetical protein
MANPFTKNDPRINRKGRPKGSPNKTVEEVRGLVQQFVENNLETLQADFEQLEPKDRLLFIERLLKHVLPSPIASLEQLSEADLDILLDKLKKAG